MHIQDNYNRLPWWNCGVGVSARACRSQDPRFDFALGGRGIFMTDQNLDSFNIEKWALNFPQENKGKEGWCWHPYLKCCMTQICENANTYTSIARQMLRDTDGSWVMMVVWLRLESTQQFCFILLQVRQDKRPGVMTDYCAERSRKIQGLNTTSLSSTKDC